MPRPIPALLGAAALLLAKGALAAEPAAPLPALSVAADGGVMLRDLGWKDDLFGALRSYTLPGAPIFGGELAIHPGAFFTGGRLAWLGIACRAEGIVGASSQRSQHEDALPTRAWAFSASLRGRLPLSFGAAFLDAGFAGRAFTIDRAGFTDPDFPSVRYLGPRLGIGAEFELGTIFRLAPRAAAARWISSGDLGSKAWFPHARAWGAELGLRLSVAVPRGFSPYVDLAWSRDIAALRPQPGEANVAGGLADDRFSTRLGLAWTLDGRPDR